MMGPVAAEYALVSLHLKAEVWTKTETNCGELLVSYVRTAASCLVSVAEDRRFELLRGCPQHAFQQCWLAFTGVHHRS